jgi:hypothetical protein
MKLLCALAALLSVASATAMTEISANSALGKSLLTNARQLADNNNAEIDFNWVSGYSIKFQGCHHIKQWNSNAEDDQDVKITTKRLVRFRLCPSGSCSGTKSTGCTSGYGDYIIDMDTFMTSYFEAKQENVEYECQHQYNTVCGGCADDGSDNFNADYCKYDCYKNAGMTQCIEENPYEADGQQAEEQFDLDQYMQCGQVKFNNRRRLNNDEVKYYVGPYCANQGGAIYLGFFSDDTCTEFSSTTFASLSGYELPYSTSSIVGEECLGCIEREEDQDPKTTRPTPTPSSNPAKPCTRAPESVKPIWRAEPPQPPSTTTPAITWPVFALSVKTALLTRVAVDPVPSQRLLLSFSPWPLPPWPFMSGTYARVWVSRKTLCCKRVWVCVPFLV